jgi:hypothetical protein
MRICRYVDIRSYYTKTYLSEHEHTYLALYLSSFTCRVSKRIQHQVGQQKKKKKSWTRDDSNVDLSQSNLLAHPSLAFVVSQSVYLSVGAAASRDPVDIV